MKPTPAEEARGLSCEEVQRRAAQSPVSGWVQAPSGRWYRIDSYGQTVSHLDFVELTPGWVRGAYMGDVFSLPRDLLRHLLAPTSRPGEYPVALTGPVPSHCGRGTYQAGTPGIAVERLGPNAWLVEVRIPDPELEGGFFFETLEVRPSEFQFKTKGESDGSE